ncbi:MAG: DUF2339 domain-containing protein [Wenzhouxiangella sp.]
MKLAVLLGLAGTIIGAMIAQGGLLGLWIGSDRWQGLLFGGLFGVVLAQLIVLHGRIATLEKQLAKPEPEGRGATPASASAPGIRLDSPASQRPTAPTTANTAPPAKPSAAPAKPPAKPPSPQAAPASTPAAPAPARERPRWLTGLTENLPVKIGVLISLIAVAALLRYLTDQGWLVFPLEARVAVVALAGMGLLAFGWKTRLQRRIFGLSLQGGGIGILILTLFASERLYGLIATLPAFVLVALMVAGTAVLAVRQSSLALAIFALVAGFAAPPALGDGQGPPLILFSWYLLLNLGVFAISLFQRWPLLSRLALIFTFLIAGLWGVLAWHPSYQLMAQAFLAAYFLLFFLIPLVEGRAGKPGGRVLNVLLLFGLPLLALPLQIALIPDAPLTIALILLGVSGLYLAAAVWLRRQADGQTLAAIHAVLAIGLATLAIPFAFSGPVIAAVWAIEGAALVWLGCRHAGRWTRLAGLALQLLAIPTWLVSYLFFSHFATSQAEQPFLNAVFIGAIAISAATMASARFYWQAGVERNNVRLWVLVFASALFWLLGFESELNAIPMDHQLNAWVAVIALSLLLIRTLLAKLPSHALQALAALLPLLLLGGVLETSLATSLLAQPSALAWLALIAAVIVVDRALAQDEGIWRQFLAVTAHLAVLLTLSHSALHGLTQLDPVGNGWRALAAAVPFLLLGGWLAAGRQPPLARVAPQAGPRQALSLVLAILLSLGGLISLPLPGNPAPLPWLPLLNPLELGQLATLLILALLAGRLGLRVPRGVLAAIALVLASLFIMRSVHQLGGIAWQAMDLWRSATVQASLSVLWTVVGASAWLVGSRRRNYPIWLAGLLLMGVVLLKLLLIDRSYLGNIAGILSFLAFGVLSMVIGYLAPAPPSPRHSRKPAS